MSAEEQIGLLPCARRWATCERGPGALGCRDEQQICVGTGGLRKVGDSPARMSPQVLTFQMLPRAGALPLRHCALGGYWGVDMPPGQVGRSQRRTSQQNCLPVRVGRNRIDEAPSLTWPRGVSQPIGAVEETHQPLDCGSWKSLESSLGLRGRGTANLRQPGEGAIAPSYTVGDTRAPALGDFVFGSICAASSHLLPSPTVLPALTALFTPFPVSPAHCGGPAEPRAVGR